MPRPRKFPTDAEITEAMLKIAWRIFTREFERAVQIGRAEMKEAARAVANTKGGAK